MDWVRIAYRVVQRRGFAGADRDRAVWGVDDRSCTNAGHGVSGICACGAHRCGAHYAVATSLARCTNPVDAAGAVRSRRLYGARSIGESEPVSLSARSSATHDLVITFSTISATRPSLRPAIVDAAASSGTGRVERVAARTLPCVVAARALPSATSIIACLRLSRNLCAVPRSGP